ncbi:MAG: DinB family protein [Balneolaceae bacterium]
MHQRIKDVLDLMVPPQGEELWHGGPTLMGCLRGIKVMQAVWKPAPIRNSIWDLTLHMAYWKHNIIAHLNPEFREEFERSPSNFPEIPKKQSEGNWKADKILLKATHEKLIQEIKAFPAEKLDEICPTKPNYTFIKLITGIAAHDTYHIGQIQVLKKLYVEMNKLG